MKITDLLSSPESSLSFEVFPPKTGSGYESVRAATEEIASLTEDLLALVLPGFFGNERLTEANFAAVTVYRVEEVKAKLSEQILRGIRYICRVVQQSIRNEDDLDSAMSATGMHHDWEKKLDKLNNGK